MRLTWRVDARTRRRLEAEVFGKRILFTDRDHWPAVDGEAPTRVLVLTTFDLDDYVYEALRAGASGFLLKDAHATDLVTAVRVVAAGDALLAPSVTRRLIADFARLRPGDPGPVPPPWSV